MTEPVRDLSKLPKWARDRIELLEANLADAHARLAAGPKDSDTIADPYSDAPQPLRPGSMIQFGSSEREGTFKVHYEDGQLLIGFQSLGSYDLVILPWSANSIRLEAKPRYRTAHS